MDAQTFTDARAQAGAASVERLRQVEAAIARAARDAGREPDGIELVAVSKTYDADSIVPVLAAGHRVFGENYVQETKGKWPGLREAYPDAEVHLIGPLQSKKARDAVALFDAIQTLDRPSLARALAKEIARARDAGERVPRLYVQVNTGEEPQKGGVAPGEADAFIAACREEHGLAIAGLMCIPPADDPPSPHFALLAEIARRNALAELSMGMSADFGAAIQMGATMVRVGSAIFGARG
ncbi:YggS family pyridoxal phosphate-dependent enzyme [Salinarimonas rosea]|uniref:YggS family pyridoxal phosphate-dependent enzyme n=1 Tax=Salinarimonas rosea TaxID=552063 RepID=UPI00048F9729|nr:YggS family pyridoxal phosphate-dependent enzyme [Salinarimonas rosea]